MRRFAIVALIAGSTAVPASAALISFDQDDFTGVTPFFSNVATFSFVIDIAAPLTPGTSYINPALNGVDYSVSGSLEVGTPSGFPAFALNRPETVGDQLTGAEFYGQGSSLSFEIAVGADLSDGLQPQDLATGTSFVFDGREVGTGRYHPAYLEISATGLGFIENSNNTGGINPATMLEVNVNNGDEYSTGLSMEPEFTLAPSPLNATVVPLPAPVLGLVGGLGALMMVRRRSRG